MGNPNKNDKLTILWTNADPITSEMMVFMYAGAALRNEWWKRVNIIVWGATTKLVADNKHIQERLLGLKANGVEVEFCISCANELGLVDEIKALGFELKPMGLPLTDVLKNDGKLLTV